MLVGLKRLITSNDGLRYSLVPGIQFPIKYTERWGMPCRAEVQLGKVHDHEVKFNISFNSLATCTVGGPTGSPSITAASLYIDYVYLDTDERRQFAQVQHEYLIEQLQYAGAESYSNTSVKSKLAFNHPVKELVWVFTGHADVEDWSNFSSDDATGNGQTVDDAKLQLNGQDRFAVRPGTYFNVVQPYQHHTRCPSDGIYVYSFALNPEQHQPSGSVNMSRIDNATLLLTLSSGAGSGQLHVYAVNYNVLRIMAGMGGLAYSN